MRNFSEPARCENLKYDKNFTNATRKLKPSEYYCKIIK